MLSLSKKTDYALLVLTTLAQQPKDYVSLRELAKMKNLPYRFLAQIARALVQGGLIISREGSGGGYRLNKPAKKISVSDVVTVIEGGVALATCLSHSETECALAENCPLKKGMPSIQRMVMKTLTQKTIADLSRGDRNKNRSSLRPRTRYGGSNLTIISRRLPRPAGAGLQPSSRLRPAGAKTTLGFSSFK